jgi:D-arginine dehydrogenase
VDADVLIVGGGVAGLSLAAALAPHRRVLLLEAEENCGHHASGRSVSFSHFGIGNRIVRALTAYSQSFFRAPPDGFSEAPLACSTPILFIATPPMLPALGELASAMTPFAPRLRELGETELKAIVPILRTGGDAAIAGLLDPDGLKLDSDALLQGYGRAARAAGATIVTGAGVMEINRSAAGWKVQSEAGATFSAPILVNAAGAWADEIAARAGIAPLGLAPLRRTAIVLGAPPGMDVRPWPFTKMVTDDFYMLPEAGRLIASPVDEIPADPCDAQPEEIDIATAAAKVEEYTSLTVRSIARSWAGLRTFAPDRTPVVGADARDPAFFWFAGQGGFGLQTAPALAAAAASLLLGSQWPQALAAQGVRAHDLAPERLIHGN